LRFKNLSAGGWWDLYTPKELRQIHADHEQYLYAESPPEAAADERYFDLDFPLSKNFTKAFELYSMVPGSEAKLVKANLIYSSNWEKEKDAFKKAHYARMRSLFIQKIAVMNFWASRGKGSSYPRFKKAEPSNGEFVAKLPDAMIDEFIWYIQRNGRDGGPRAVEILGDFGPRAERAYLPIREWGLGTGDRRREHGQDRNGQDQEAVTSSVAVHVPHSIHEQHLRHAWIKPVRRPRFADDIPIFSHNRWQHGIPLRDDSVRRPDLGGFQVRR
jgi:hypothetical protein